MDRKEFLSMFGISAAAITLAHCMEGCKKQGSNITAPSVNFTLNLSDPANAALKNNGGYLYSNGVIVARTMTGAYIAVSQACTHAGVTVQYESAQNDFYCPAHGSSFSASGSVTGGPAPSPLKSYSTSLSGTSLHVSG